MQQQVLILLLQTSSFFNIYICICLILDVILGDGITTRTNNNQKKEGEFFFRRGLFVDDGAVWFVLCLVEDRRIAKHTTTEILAHAPIVLFTYFAEYRSCDGDDPTKK